jgi:hypothetical protein
MTAERDAMTPGAGLVPAEVEAAGQTASAARLGAEQIEQVFRKVRARRPPEVNDDVLYQSYGTPGGEYRPTGRAAKVTEVGAWLTIGNSRMGDPNKSVPAPVDGDERSLLQRYSAMACTLFVMNPTGVFLNGPIEYHSGRDEAGAFLGFPGGTWHWREDEPAA